MQPQCIKDQWLPAGPFNEVSSLRTIDPRVAMFPCKNLITYVASIGKRSGSCLGSPRVTEASTSPTGGQGIYFVASSQRSNTPGLRQSGVVTQNYSWIVQLKLLCAG